MNEPTNDNDIDALLRRVDPHCQFCGLIDAVDCARYHRALTALVAERDALRERVAELENPIRNPLSRALELEEALRHMKQRGGGANGMYTQITDDEFSDAIKQLDLRAELAEMKKQLAEARGLYLQRNYHREQLERELAAAKAELAAAIKQRDEARDTASAIHKRNWYEAKTEYGTELGKVRVELAAAIKQRDEARREVCDMVARKRRKMGVRGQIVGMDRVVGEEVAAERGWDCFAQQEGGGA